MRTNLPFTPHQPRFGALAWTQNDTKQLEQDFQNKRVLFWDVDTQKGFMDPIATKKIDGQVRRVGLQVPKAEEILPNLSRLTQLVERFKLPGIATMDSHDANDPEFRHFTAVSDEHCRKGAADWAKIPETTRPGIPLNVEVSPSINDTPRLKDIKQAFSQGRSIVIEKNTISAFEHRLGKTAQEEHFEPNRKAISIVEGAGQLGVKQPVVYGVATDFCVKAAVQGLKTLGLRPIVVQDAIRGVNTNDLESPALKDVYDDVTVISTQQLESITKQSLT